MTKKKPLQTSDVLKTKRGKVKILNVGVAKKVCKLRDEKKAFNQIEKELGLSQQNGMVAYRIYKAVQKGGSHD